MLPKIILLFSLSILICNALCSEKHSVRFDYMTGRPVTKSQLSHYRKVQQVDNCTTTIELPCDPNEWRRVDGSCNNLKEVSRGTFFNQMLRMLPAHYSDGNEPRKAMSGNTLPKERSTRVSLLKMGTVPDVEHTIIMPGFGIFMYGDIGSVHDINQYIVHERHCCEPGWEKNPWCAPNLVDEDDPVHRLDGVRCLNMTRPVTYQDFKCTNDPTPAPIAQATPNFDLSMIYNQENKGVKEMRTFKSGHFIVEEENGKIWPPNGPVAQCLLNEPDETRCFKFHRNALLSIQLFVIWFIRNHNFIADELAKVNPCWDDETLFQTARDINIAHSLQMYIYEWLGELAGKEYLTEFGVIPEEFKHRDLYDPELYPMVYLEYALCLRWFHTSQETKGKMYDLEGKYVKTTTINDLSFRTGWLAKEKNMDMITQGCFRQESNDWRYGVDPDMVERGLGNLQKVSDTMAGDLNKSRRFGTAPYVDYVKLCTGCEINSFDDLVKCGVMTREHVALLKNVYEDYRDIDLMAGLWVEKSMEGAYIPKTLACILATNMHRAIKADRHFYDRPNRPHAFTEKQLAEIKKLTFSRLLCNVGDNVQEVQPSGFKTISPENPLTPCSEIPQMDFSAWASCDAK